MTAGQIPQSFIENLLARTDIVEVIGTRINLKHAGANFVACCPFHIEKTPSFTVSAGKQFYHCFGCGVSGDAIQFLTEYEGLHFIEAVETLAGRLGLTVPIESQAGHNAARFLAIYHCLAEASSFYQMQLRNHPEASLAQKYLKSRGLTGKIAKYFHLGYAPTGWDNLVQHLGTDKTRLEVLVAAGLAVKKEPDRLYDRFRERIIFPIRDRRGRVVGFGGRVLGSQGEPKYLNSPETVVFNKGQELYGLYEARSGNRVLKQLVVVEGYIDVVSLVQAGIKNVVATLGTALTAKQVEMLFRQVSELIFCFDGDKAGKKAAERALSLILPHMKEGLRVRFIVLPEGEDPDSFVRNQGTAAFLECIERAVPLSDFLFDQVTAGVDLQHLDGRAQLITLAKPLIKLLPAGIFQQMLYDRLAELTGVDSAAIQGKNQAKPKHSFVGRSVVASTRSLPPDLAYRAAAILIKKRDLLTSIDDIDAFEGIDIPGIPLLCGIIAILRANSHIEEAVIEEHLPAELRSQFSYKSLKAITDSIPESGMEQELLGAMQRLKASARERAMESLLMKAKTGVLSLEEKAYLKTLLAQRQ